MKLLIFSTILLMTLFRFAAFANTELPGLQCTGQTLAGVPVHIQYIPKKFASDLIATVGENSVLHSVTPQLWMESSVTRCPAQYAGYSMSSMNKAMSEFKSLSVLTEAYVTCFPIMPQDKAEIFTPEGGQETVILDCDLKVEIERSPR